jgi:hypothetical protein
LEKSNGNVTLCVPTDRWEENIKMYLGEIGREGVGWVELVQNMVQWDFYESCDEPSGSECTLDEKLIGITARESP